MKSKGVTTQMKALDAYFLMVVFMLLPDRDHVFTSLICKGLILADCFVGFDGEELNVLDDILGEPANDEFAAELDKAAKSTSMCYQIFFFSCTQDLSVLMLCFTFICSTNYRYLSWQREKQQTKETLE